MAFKKSGSEKHSKINIIEPVKELPRTLQANSTNIICKHCKQIIGSKIGNIYQVLDKQYVSENGIICPKCGK